MMRRGAYLTTVAALVLALTSTASASPQRTVVLSAGAASASWTSDFRLGPYFGSPFDCDREHLGCETTLIKLTAPGDLTVQITQSLPTWQADGRLLLKLLRSDAQGNAGTGVKADKVTEPGGTVTLTASRLPAGFYLAEVHWGELAVGDYTGKASLKPNKRR